ncbi:MAG TPA: cysteine--tRNA ligase [Haliangiales bacterium]|nr:cysteine--tRNA ligase [Haliangiales bacterium]
MPLRLHDSYQRRKVDFAPIAPGKVGIYLCGPTPQAAPHIGHARSAIAFDMVRRHFAWSGYDVTFVRNVTDLDDKIIDAAAARGVSAAQHAAEFAEEYRAQMLAVGALPPTHEPRVTETVPDILAFIERLIAAGKAYPLDGDVYYAVEAFPAYGALSGQDLDALRAGARIEVDERKQSPFDFALWKGAKPGEPAWDSPWGPGRPGWHIECSAMALATLGVAFDIHGGGKDLIFPHHENEIAQSVGALGPGTFARYWMHNGLINLKGEKMSKSLGNVFLVSELRRHFDGESIRHYCLSTHYRSPIDFEFEEVAPGKVVFPGLEDAERRLEYFYATLSRIDDFLSERNDADAGALAPGADGLVAAVRAAMDDDFNSAVALAALGEAAKVANRLLDDPRSAPKDVRRRSIARLGADLRDAARGPLGLLEREPRAFLHGRRDRLSRTRGIDGAAVAARLVERDEARRAKDFTRADAIREELRALGIEVMDTPRGADWRVS